MSPQVFGVPSHHFLWNKGGLEEISTEDVVISLSLLSLELQELVLALPRLLRSWKL